MARQLIGWLQVKGNENLYFPRRKLYSQRGFDWVCRDSAKNKDEFFDEKPLFLNLTLKFTLCSFKGCKNRGRLWYSNSIDAIWVTICRAALTGDSWLGVLNFTCSFSFSHKTCRLIRVCKNYLSPYSSWFHLQFHIKLNVARLKRWVKKSLSAFHPPFTFSRYFKIFLQT